MTDSGALRGAILAGAAFLTMIFSLPARTQTAPASHEVRKGEGLFAISGKLRYEGVTRFQIVIAIFRANADAFAGGNIHALREGQILRLPGQDEVAAISAAEATREWQSLIAKPAAAPSAPLAAAKAPPAVAAPARPPAGAALGRADQVRLYREGLALERKGDDQGALKAFLEAGESGYGLAQRKLGQIYDKGNAAVQRDYQASLRWYQKAREQGVEIARPLPRMTAK